MKIYVAHSTNFDYKTELYQPLRNSPLNFKHEIILPHETDQFINSKKIIKISRVIIAEVSYPSTGEGIELGWANDAQIPIICIYKKENKPSHSLKTLSNIFIPYKNTNDMIERLSSVLSTFQK